MSIRLSDTVPNQLPLTDKAIGIDYTAAFEQNAGIGRLVRDLIGGLAQLDTQTHYKLFVAGATFSQLPSKPSQNFNWKPTRVTPLWFARLWHRAQLPLPVEAFTGMMEMFHATDFVLPPSLPHTKTILTVHDLSFVRTPETATPVLKRYLDTVVPRSVQRADHIIADSQATKDDLIELYQTPAEKVSVVLSGVDKRYQPINDTQKRTAIRNKYNIPADVPFIFSIGTVQPRKNYGRLIEALAILRQKFPDLYLVIAGGKGWLDTPIFDTVKRFQLEDVVIFTGFVDDEDVPVLYSDAVCTSYVSLYEGFGFPVVESMACGTPVVTSDVSSLPEVAGDAALTVNPYDVEAIAHALEQLLDNSDLRAKLIESGKQQAAKFTWQKSAQTLLDVYRLVLAK